MNQFQCPKCLSNLDTINLQSDSIANGFTNKYLTRSSQVSPKLSWNPVFGAKSYALICIDPDVPSGGEWKHWVLLNIPASLDHLPESEIERNRVWNLDLNGEKYQIIQGRNSWGDYGYGGPAPPKGSGVHRYYFCLYALDIELDSNWQNSGNRNNGNRMMNEIEDHVIACGHMMQTFYL